MLETLPSGTALYYTALLHLSIKCTKNNWRVAKNVSTVFLQVCDNRIGPRPPIDDKCYGAKVTKLGDSFYSLLHIFYSKLVLALLLTHGERDTRLIIEFLCVEHYLSLYVIKGSYCLSEV